MFDFSELIKDIVGENELLVTIIIIGSTYIAGLIMIGILFTGWKQPANTLGSDK